MKKIDKLLNNIDEDKYLDNEKPLSENEKEKIFNMTMDKIKNSSTNFNGIKPKFSYFDYLIELQLEENDIQTSYIYKFNNIITVWIIC